MAKIKCEVPSDHRQQYGFGKNFIRSVSKTIDESKLTGERLKALMENLGLDDLRAVHLRSGKAHIFGRNLADIQEWKGGKIPNDTLVKKTNADGEVEYFISKNSTEQPPTKFIIQNKTIKKNPDWTYVGKNVTVDDAGALKRFKRVGHGEYVEDPSGTDLLKIVKPYSGDKAPPMYKLAQDGYDAIKRPDGSYKVFDEASQVTDARVAFKRNESSAMTSEVENVTKEDFDEKAVAEQLQSLGVGKKAAYSLAGYVAGSMVDNWAETESGSWIGGALGLALSMPKARGALKDAFNIKGNEYEDFSRALDQAGDDVKETQELIVEGGYRGDPADAEAKAEFKERFYNSYKKMKQAGQNTWNFIFRNNYLMSGMTQLWDWGSKTAKDLLRKFQGLETYHTTLFGDFGESISRNFGREFSLDDFRDVQAKVMRDYLDANPKLAERFPDASDEFLQEQMGSGIFRIITHETSVDDSGRLLYNQDSVAAKEVYSNETTQEIDRFILQSDEGSRVVKTVKETFEKYTDELEGTYKDNFDELMRVDVPAQYKQILRDMRKDGLTVKQWQHSATEDQLKAFNKAKENMAFKEAVELNERLVKLDNLRGRYFPQIWSNNKAQIEKQKFFERKGLVDADKSTRQTAWEEYKLRQILENNRDNYKAMEVMSSGDDVQAIYMKNFKDIHSKLRDELSQRITNDEVRRRVIQDLDSGVTERVDKYFGKTMKGGKERWYIKQPEGIEHNILRDINKDALGTANKTYLNMITLHQADQLDNPRNFILPSKFIETDIEQVVRRYTQDAGNRMYLMQNGLGTKTGLERQLQKVANELQEKNVAESDIAENIDKVKSWYSNMTRTSDAIEIDMSEADRIARYNNKRRNNKLVRTLMNFGYMPFLWFTSFYSVFQPFITGPFMASYKNIGKTYKQFFKDPQQFKRLTDEMHKMGIIQRKVSSFSAEMQPHYSKDALAGNDGGLIDWLYGISERGVHFSSHFSLVKPMLKKLDIDLENAGLLRFFAGDMLDISGAESALTTMSVFRELEALTEAGELMLKAPDQMSGRVSANQIRQYLEENPDFQYSVPKQAMEIELNGHTYRWGDMKRKLEELGIRNPQRFIEESRQVNKSLSGEVSNVNSWMKKLTGQVGDEFELSPYLNKEYTMVADTIVNQLHGRTRLSRPLRWTDNPYGRLLSQFSVYAQNFSVQTIRRRIYQPVKDWFDAYEIPKDESLMKTMWHMRNGNDAELKRIFGDKWEQAYNDFPVDAFNNAFKVMPVVMGTGAAMMVTRDMFMDFINMITSEALGNDDYEAWKNTRKRFASTQDWFDGDKVGYDTAKMALAGLRNAVDMGFAGRAGQIFINESRYTQGGLWSKTPVTGMINDGFEAITQPFRSSPEDLPRATARSIAEFVALRSPVIGSFNQFRGTLVNSVFQKPKNRDVKFFDGDNGLEIDNLEIMDL